MKMVSLLWKNGHKVALRESAYNSSNGGPRAHSWFDLGVQGATRPNWYKPEFPYGKFSMEAVATNYPWLRFVRDKRPYLKRNWSVVCFEEDWEKFSKFLGGPHPFKGFSWNTVSKAARAEGVRVAYVGIRDLESYEKGLERFT